MMPADPPPIPKARGLEPAIDQVSLVDPARPLSQRRTPAEIARDLGERIRHRTANGYMYAGATPAGDVLLVVFLR